MKIAIAVTAALTLGACAANTVPVPMASAEATSFTGWVKVSGGEFQLYPEQRQLDEPFSRPCVSGALPRNAQMAAGDLSGSQVTFTGRTAAWSEATNQVLLHEGARISNQCRGERVILADSVRVLR